MLSILAQGLCLTWPSAFLCSGLCSNITYSESFIWICHQFSSVTQSCPPLCDLVDCSTPGLPVHHQLLEFTQTHVHWVGDTIQPSHPLSSPSPPTFNLSQHQGLFQWVNYPHTLGFDKICFLKSSFILLVTHPFQWRALLCAEHWSRLWGCSHGTKTPFTQIDLNIIIQHKGVK